MATIGTFTKTENDFAGAVKTLTLNVKVPDFRIFARQTEFGAAWKKKSSEGREYARHFNASLRKEKGDAMSSDRRGGRNRHECANAPPVVAGRRDAGPAQSPLRRDQMSEKPSSPSTSTSAQGKKVDGRPLRAGDRGAAGPRPDQPIRGGVAREPGQTTRSHGNWPRSRTRQRINGACKNSRSRVNRGEYLPREWQAPLPWQGRVSALRPEGSNGRVWPRSAVELHTRC